MIAAAQIEQLYDRHGATCYSLALRLLNGSQTDAERAVELVFGELRSAPSLVSEVDATIQRRLLSRLHTLCQAHKGSMDSGWATSATTALWPLPGRTEPLTAESAGVRVALSKVSPIARRAIEMAYFDGKSCSEIGRTLHRSEDDIHRVLTQGLRVFRMALQDEKKAPAYGGSPGAVPSRNQPMSAAP